MSRTKETNIPEILEVPRTDAIYNCHGYLTKVPVKAIIPFVKNYSEPGEKVVDFFAGSGMTAIASVMSGRDAIVSDISALGQHIAQGYLSKTNHKELSCTASEVISTVRNKVGSYYQTIRTEDNAPVEMKRTIWSFVYSCPQCDTSFNFYENVMKNPDDVSKDICVECGEHFNKRKWCSSKHITKRPDVPVCVVVNGVRGKQVEQPIQSIDLEKIELAKNDDLLKHIPSLTIDSDREMYSRSGLKNRGISETKDFFCPRNAIVLKVLWDTIQDIQESSIRKKLEFAFTAILPRASKRYQWSKQRPLNAQNQTYYIAPVYYEWNVFELFLRKVNAAIKSDSQIFGNGDKPLLDSNRTGKANYHLASADNLVHIDDNSVDYIFTDPPFGSNIFYSDMSMFHEAWIGMQTSNEKEAVIYTCGKRKAEAPKRYEELLRNSFKEAFRILKPGKFMSVVFGNSNGSVWSLVLRALREAGFDSVPENVTILDKGQRSVKGLSSGSESVVTVDLILTVHKSNGEHQSVHNGSWQQAEPDSLIPNAINEAKNGNSKNPSYIYAKVLREAIRQHLLVDNLHLSDVLIALRNAGYSIDTKTGQLLNP